MAANRKAPFQAPFWFQSVGVLVTGVKQEILSSGTSESPKRRFTVRGHGPLQQKLLPSYQCLGGFEDEAALDHDVYLLHY